MADFDKWYNATLGKQVDIDGAYGDQCVDIALSWAQFCFPGHSWTQTIGYGNAKDLFAGANDTYFGKHHQVPPAQGDLVVFGATSTNPYGHIAAIISADSSYMHVIEQNGFNPSGVAYTAQRPYNNVIGFLRPKGEDVPNITTEDVVALSLATTGKQPSNNDETKYINQPADRANLDGLITYWAGKSRIKELEKAVADRDKLLGEIQAKVILNDSLQKKADDLTAQQTKDTETGNSFLRWIGNFFNSNK